MSIFMIIMIITLVITTILFFWMKRKAKKSINYIAQVVAPTINIQNRGNQNIGSDGRNVNLLGTCATCLFVSIFTAAFLMTLINYHSDSIAEGIFLVPVMSLICPSIFYFNNPQSFGIIKDTLF